MISPVYEDEQWKQLTYGLESLDFFLYKIAYMVIQGFKVYAVSSIS